MSRFALGSRPRRAAYALSAICFAAAGALGASAPGDAQVVGVAPPPPEIATPRPLPSPRFGGRNPFAAPRSLVAAAAPSPTDAPVPSTTVSAGTSSVPDFGGGGTERAETPAEIVVSAVSVSSHDAIADVTVRAGETQTVRVGDTVGDDRVVAIRASAEWTGVAFASGRRTALDDTPASPRAAPAPSPASAPVFVPAAVATPPGTPPPVAAPPAPPLVPPRAAAAPPPPVPAESSSASAFPPPLAPPARP